MFHRLRPALAIGVSWLCVVQSSVAQQANIEPERPNAPLLLRPYQAPTIPAIRTSNSGRMRQLVQGGKLYLTAQDAIALALENNIDIEVARYNPIIADWNLERAQAGGALPGVPSGASQAGTVASGQGVVGSQQAAGVSGQAGGLSRSRNNTNNAQITQIGPVTQNLDTSIQNTTAFAHQTTLFPNNFQSGVFNLVQATRSYSTSIQQGFLTGGRATLQYQNTYLSENAPTDVLNPTVAPVATLSVQHNLLNGFGIAVNSRTITVARANVNGSDAAFRTQVIAVVTTVLNAYYGLVADNDDVKAKQSAVDVAQQFYRDNQRQVQIGTMAPLDVVSAESQVATAQQDLVVSQTNLLQQEVALKNTISRNGLADPLLANVSIVPIDKIYVPDKDDLPPLTELTQKALVSRTDLVTQKLTVTNAQTSALGTQNAVLPSLGVFASTTQAGLSGTPQTVVDPGGAVEVSDPYFQGGLKNGLGQMFRRNFPSNTLVPFFNATLRNRSAQGDYGIDQLQLRQSQLTNQKQLNQIAVDVANQVTSLQQARVRYLAAARARVLSQQLLEAEQKKFSLGASTPFNVITQQRDLSTAQSAEVTALTTYSSSRVALGQVVGTTLDEYHVNVKEALSGHVNRVSELPAKLPKP